MGRSWRVKYYSRSLGWLQNMLEKMAVLSSLKDVAFAIKELILCFATSTYNAVFLCCENMQCCTIWSFGINTPYMFLFMVQCSQAFFIYSYICDNACGRLIYIVHNREDGTLNNQILDPLTDSIWIFWFQAAVDGKALDRSYIVQSGICIGTSTEGAWATSRTTHQAFVLGN